MPSTGTIAALQWPHHPHARLEFDLSIGTKITPFFDPMIAKIQCYGNDRTYAIATMQSLLRRLFIAGISTNQPLLMGILHASFFSAGSFHTQTLADQDLVTLLSQDQHASTDEELIAGLAFILAQMQATSTTTEASVTRQWKDQSWR
jgi:acetyl/propionyl-CoA carboxylase alpha subunit